VRIFTPTFEMPFAGHPTLGSAHVCRALGMAGDSLRLELQAGIIPVDASGNRWTLWAPSPTWREPGTPPAVLARALGLREDDIGERPLWVKAGTEQLIVPLTSEDAVRRTSPQLAAGSAIQNELGVEMIYVFARRGAGKTLARFFFVQGAAMLEDPATGSATANFGGWCIATDRPLPLHCEISQGEMAGRPSSLYLEVDIDRRIGVSGDVIEIAAGAVRLS
jgi:PhzF family phenazine biosynthesis protein